MTPLRFAIIAMLACVVGACASSPSTPPSPGKPAVASAQAMVATIRASGRDDSRELSVQPLRDPMVEDLRQQAATLERAGKPGESAAALDKALAITPDDPALLQERAEAAILAGDLPGAEQRARRAFDIGSKVGPLCRRHWATVRQVRFAAGDGAGAAEAGKQLEACKVAALDRF